MPYQTAIEIAKLWWKDVKIVPTLGIGLALAWVIIAPLGYWMAGQTWPALQALATIVSESSDRIDSLEDRQDNIERLRARDRAEVQLRDMLQELRAINMELMSIEREREMATARGEPLPDVYRRQEAQHLTRKQELERYITQILRKHPMLSDSRGRT